MSERILPFIAVLGCGTLALVRFFEGYEIKFLLWSILGMLIVISGKINSKRGDKKK